MSRSKEIYQELIPAARWPAAQSQNSPTGLLRSHRQPLICRRAFSLNVRKHHQRTALGHMMYGFMYGFFLWPFTLINSLLFAAGVCAWALWGSRQRDAQSELVDRLIGRKPTAWLNHVGQCNCVAGSRDALPQELSLSTISLK